MPEQPLYVVYQDSKRVLIPKAVQLIILGGLFYFGLMLNLYLLRVEDAKLINLFAIVGITVLIILQLLLISRKIKTEGYVFYSNRVEFGKKSVFYGNIRNIYFKRGLLDKMFGTGTIVLHPYMDIKKIKNSNQIYFYVQKLVRTRPVY